MTSVSRSEHDDEAPEGTGTGVSADRERAGAPSGPRAVESTDAAASPTTPKSPRTPRATKTTKSSTNSKGTTAAKAANASKSPRATTSKNAARAAAAEDASGDEAKSTAGSKRTAASQAASSKAAAARGEAAKTARAARTPATKTPAARGRAATASTKRQTQQVAAAITTETTAAERANRKADDASASAPADALASAAAAVAPVASEIDETTRERPAPRRGAAAAASVGVAAAVGAAEPVIAQPQTPEAPTAEVPTAEVPTAEVPETVVPVVPAGAEEAMEAVAPEEAAAPVEAVASEETLAPAEAVAPEEAAAPVAPVAATEPEASAAASGTAMSGDQAIVVIPAPRKPAPRKKRTLRVARAAPAPGTPRVLAIEGLVKKFGDNTAVDEISLDVRAGSFYGIVGPNGAGKTTTLSMVTGLLRPDAGTVRINDIDAWKDPRAAKRATGVLPDRLRLFDRLTGAQLLYYAGSLRGIDDRTVRERSTELIAAFGLEDAVDRLVADYSAGMTKKIALACAMIHAPRLLVLDEPFESVDPVSAANLTDILERYVEGGGTVLLSSHGMDLIERVCDSAAIIVGGRVLAQGTLDEVRGSTTLEDRFVELAGGRKAAEGMEWLHSFSD